MHHARLECTLELLLVYVFIQGVCIMISVYSTYPLEYFKITFAGYHRPREVDGRGAATDLAHHRMSLAGGQLEPSEPDTNQPLLRLPSTLRAAESEFKPALHRITEYSYSFCFHHRKQPVACKIHVHSRIDTIPFIHC